MLTRGQRRVRHPDPRRRGRLHRPAARPATTCRCPTCRCATSPSASSPPGSTPPPAPRSTSPSRSRRCRRTCARCSRRSCSASPGSGRSCWPAIEIRLVRRHLAQAQDRARSGCGVADRIGDAPGATTAAATPPAPGCSTRSAGCCSTGRCKDRLGHAQGALRRLGRRADRARGAAVLHGHRGADARGLRHDREHRDRHRQPARAGSSSARSARPHPGIELRIDPETGEILTRHAGVFAGYWRNPEATARARRPRTAGCTPATSASGSTARTCGSPTG